jgi:hypothetical protein
LTAHQCSGGATGRCVRSRAALLRVRISPRTPSFMQDRLVAQLGRGNTLRPCPVSVRIRPSLPKSACSPTGRDSGLKSRTVPVRIRPGAPYAPVPMVRRADSKPAIGCSNHPWGAMRRNSKWRAAELQPRCARFDSAAALQVFRMRRSGRVAKVTSPENWRESVRATEG